MPMLTLRVEDVVVVGVVVVGWGEVAGWGAAVEVVQASPHPRSQLVFIGWLHCCRSVSWCCSCSSIMSASERPFSRYPGVAVERALLSAVAAELRCSICFDALNDPVSLLCSHVFCRQCICQSLQVTPNQCPLCKGRADQRSMVAVALLSDIIALAKEVGRRTGVEDIMETQSPSLPPALPIASVNPPFVLPVPTPRDVEASWLVVPSSVSVPTSLLLELETLSQGIHLAKTQVIPRSISESATLDEPFREEACLGIAEVGQETQHLGAPSDNDEDHPPCDVAPPNGDGRCGSSEMRMPSSDSGTLDDSADSPQAFQGPCALCQLDTSNRKQIRQFLRGIIDVDPTCRGEEIQALDQDKLETMLGNLCGPFAGISRTRAGAPAAPLYAHYLCLLWSPEVFIDRGRLVHTEDAIKRGRSLSCSFCGLKGATFGCANRRCRRSFHIPCAHLTGRGVCTIDHANYALYCNNHTPSEPPVEGAGTE